MNQKTFEQWKLDNPELVETIENEPTHRRKDCWHCDGTGEHECDCGNIHDCNHCDGTGKEGGEEFQNKSLRDIYEKQIAAEKAKLESWNRSALQKG